MQIRSRTITHTSRSDSFKLTFLGDVHFGARDCDVARFRACVRKIAEDKSHYWIGVGDMGEYVNISDKRYDPAERDRDIDEDDLAYQQVRAVAKELSSIRSACLGIHCGNHEETIRVRYHANVHARLCELMQNDFGELDFGYCCITKLRFIRKTPSSAGSRVIKLCGHHGAGGGRKDGSSINRMEDLLLAFPGNQIYYKGHDHKRHAWVQTAIGAAEDKDEEVEFPMAFACTGGFKKTYQQGTRTYAEKGMMKPTPLGCVSLIIQPSAGKHGELRISAYNSTDGLPA